MGPATRNQNNKIARRGLMLVLSSPSGAGKTTLSRLLLRVGSQSRAVDLGDHPAKAPRRNRRPRLLFHRSRSLQRYGRPWRTLEWAEVFGHRYGTPRAPVIKALHAGRDVLFDIDWQGTQQLREKARTDLVSVFILPPTAKELERRLKRSDQDSKTVIGSRMAKAAGEMSHWPEYDYVIVNRDKREAFANCAPSLPPSGSSANARSVCMISCAGCKRSFQIEWPPVFTASIEHLRGTHIRRCLGVD